MGQAVLDGVSLNKIGIKDITLAIETSNQVIKLGYDKALIQKRLIPRPTQASDNSGSILSGTSKVISLGGQ